MELAERVAALGDDPNGPPKAWEDNYVGRRFIAAIRVGGRHHGPKEFGNNWPLMLVEFSDRVDRQARELADRNLVPDDDEDAQEADEARLEAPHLVEEALAWPMQYLQGNPRAAAALITWAMGKARLVKVRAVCRRMRAAERSVRVVAASANLPAVGPLGPREELQRRALALWRGRLIEDEEALARRRADVARIANGHPYVASVTSMHRWRKQALEIIRKALTRARVEVR